MHRCLFGQHRYPHEPLERQRLGSHRPSRGFSRCLQGEAGGPSQSAVDDKPKRAEKNTTGPAAFGPDQQLAPGSDDSNERSYRVTLYLQGVQGISQGGWGNNKPAMRITADGREPSSSHHQQPSQPKASGAITTVVKLQRSPAGQHSTFEPHTCTVEVVVCRRWTRLLPETEHSVASFTMDLSQFCRPCGKYEATHLRPLSDSPARGTARIHVVTRPLDDADPSALRAPPPTPLRPNGLSAPAADGPERTPAGGQRQTTPAKAASRQNRTKADEPHPAVAEVEVHLAPRQPSAPTEGLRLDGRLLWV